MRRMTLVRSGAARWAQEAGLTREHYEEDTPSRLRSLVRDKLQEELEELLAANSDASGRYEVLEEVVDLMDAAMAYARLHGFTSLDVEDRRLTKNQQRGQMLSFTGSGAMIGLVMERSDDATTTPEREGPEGAAYPAGAGAAEGS
jgi:predicted house-cleaning noncanonical NTP pyrophosphatase (MazG superfamily)